VSREIALRRRLAPWLALEHLVLVLALVSGLALMIGRGYRFGYPRWLGLKLGLVVFLIVPLEAMHAYVCHVWIARGLRQTAAPPFSRDLSRGIGIDEMIRTLALVLLSIALPLILWLCVKKPF
jgi:hypothetical protein